MTDAKIAKVEAEIVKSKNEAAVKKKNVEIVKKKNEEK